MASKKRRKRNHRWLYPYDIPREDVKKQKHQVFQRRHARKTEIYGRCLFQARPTLQLPRLGKEKVSSCAFI